MPLAELALESTPEVALHGGGAKALPSPQPTPIDAVQVLLIDGLLKRLAGPLITQNAGQRLAGVAPALQAFRFGNLQVEHAVAQSPVFVTHRSLHPTLVAQLPALA